MHKVISLNSVLGNYPAKFVDNISEIEFLLDSPNTFVFIDQKVQTLYPSLYREKNIAVECVESNKTLEMSAILLQRMMELGIKSNSTVLVIGGGILQDLVGFCCSVYHRGVKYILIPTTLLAQADSCIGGKTSINFNKKKNILGTFYPPKEIILCTSFLDTLEQIEYVSGMGEIFKFHILQNKIESFGHALNKSNINQTIFESLSYKKNILDVDEFDLKERKFLNFGHTFGHALEFTSDNKIPHGVGVILGSLTSCIISTEMGYEIRHFELIQQYAKELLSGIELNEAWFKLENILEAAKQDKKNTGKLVDVLMSTDPILVEIEDTSLIETALLRTFKLMTGL